MKEQLATTKLTMAVGALKEEAAPRKATTDELGDVPFLALGELVPAA